MRFPAREEFSRALGPIEVRTLPVPHDCLDGFLGAFWRRPEAYLDPDVRWAMSGFSQLPSERVGTRASRVSPTISAAAGGRSASARCASRTAPISGIAW